jgi:hypothetical protein
VSDTQWWVLAPEPGVLLWARLRLREDGGAELLESTGLTLRFDDLDGGRHYLLSADYRAWDGLDADDAGAMGFALDAVQPPDASDERTLVAGMTQHLA